MDNCALCADARAADPESALPVAAAVWACVQCHVKLCAAHRDSYRLDDNDLSLYNLAADVPALNERMQLVQVREVCKRCVFPLLLSLAGSWRA